MKEYSYKRIFLLFFYYQFFALIAQTKCSNMFAKIRNGENKKDDPSPQDMMKELEALKVDIQSLTKDVAKYNTLIYILMPTAIILFLIFVGFLIYEIVKSCKKKSQDLNTQNRNSNAIYEDNLNKIKTYSTTDSTSLKISRNNDVKNSFTSTNVYENDTSLKNQNIFNSFQQNGNIEKSNNFKETKNNGYEAPVIEEHNDNQQEEKYFTNNGEFDKNDNENYQNISNPFVK